MPDFDKQDNGNTQKDKPEAKPQDKPKEKPKDKAKDKPKETNSEAIPDYSRITLVPVANPQTASELLHMAVALAHPENGKVIALIVSTGTMENEASAIEELQPVIDELEEEGHSITLETVSSTSIARGILDAAREQGADLIILGIRQPSRGQVILGTVVENVIATAPSDVLIYRSSSQDNVDIKRIVIPVDEVLQAQSAARTGIRLARRNNLRIEAMYVQPRYRSQYEGLAYIERTLDDCPGHRMVKRTVLNAQNPAQAILTRTEAEDLIMVGFTQRNELERMIFGDLSREILNQAEGPVIVVTRSVGGDELPTRLRRQIIGWLRPTLTRVEQGEIVRQARESSTINIDYVILIIVSATLASLGLLLNSAAVIIGAMLVAPLISPLIAFSTGITVGNPILVRRALITLVAGILLALGFSMLSGVIIPNRSITPEMTSRGVPTLLDAIIALASGVIGAYATARKDIPAALAGVAIAAALMPPLCTVGLGLVLGDSRLAAGAAVLFTTNIISIIIAGAVVFAYLGMSPRRQENERNMRALVSLVLVLIFSIPVIYLLSQLTAQASEQQQIGDHLRKMLAPAELVSFEVDYDNDPTFISATVRSVEGIGQAQAQSVEAQLAETIDSEVELQLVVWQVVVAAPDLPELTPEATAESIEATPEATAEPD